MIELSIYVAGPMYSSGMLCANVRAAVQLGAELEEIALACGARVHVFVPHTGLFIQQMVAPRSHEDAQTWDDYFLRKCDAVYRLPGKSTGSDHEEALAKSLNMPVFTNRYAFTAWVTAQVQARKRAPSAEVQS